MPVPVHSSRGSESGRPVLTSIVACMMPCIGSAQVR
jgi:hypothetical protein